MTPTLVYLPDWQDAMTTFHTDLTISQPVQEVRVMPVLAGLLDATERRDLLESLDGFEAAATLEKAAARWDTR